MISLHLSSIKEAGMDILSVKILVFFLTRNIFMKDIFSKIMASLNQIKMALI